ncbi:hypothetical protein [Roseobacter sp.]|nr:hypothetical protein [Roseobacter sp.]
MKTNKRFIRSVIKTADTSKTEMPWQRGVRRAAFIAKRAGKEQPVARSA